MQVRSSPNSCNRGCIKEHTIIFKEPTQPTNIAIDFKTPANYLISRPQSLITLPDYVIFDRSLISQVVTASEFTVLSTKRRDHINTSYVRVYKPNHRPVVIHLDGEHITHLKLIDQQRKFLCVYTLTHDIIFDVTTSQPEHIITTTANFPLVPVTTAFGRWMNS